MSPFIFLCRFNALDYISEQVSFDEMISRLSNSRERRLKSLEITLNRRRFPRIQDRIIQILNTLSFNFVHYLLVVIPFHAIWLSRNMDRVVCMMQLMNDSSMVVQRCTVPSDADFAGSGEAMSISIYIHKRAYHNSWLLSKFICHRSFSAVLWLLAEKCPSRDQA
jgi:hypothetical protein